MLSSAAVSTHNAFLDAQVATLKRHRSRLAVVREHKAKARLEMLGELDGPVVRNQTEMIQRWK